MPLSTRGKNLVRGVTSLEIIVIIAVLLTTLTIAIPLLLNKSSENRENITWKKLNAIRHAIIGDASLAGQNNRLSFGFNSTFGFVGDVGILPTALNELIVRYASRPAYQAYGVNTGMFFGWNGPYLDNTTDSNGNYTALLDAWGRPFVKSNTTAWDIEIRSLGANGIAEVGIAGSDDIFMGILDQDCRTYVKGKVTDKDGQAINETAVTIYYPNGTNGAQPVTAIPIALKTTIDYDSLDSASKIPIGHRYFVTATNTLKKLVTLYQQTQTPAIVNFVGLSITPTAPEFERNFYATDDTSATGSPITILNGNWHSDDNGNYFVDNNTNGEYRVVFGNVGWEDYRVEVDATLIQGTITRPSRGYGIYYRSDGKPNISGYCFQYDPGLTSGGRVAFVVRKVFNTQEQDPFQSIIMSLAQFPDVYGVSHHISITVRGNRHIIKVDGNPIFDFTDNTFMVGQPGLRSWDGQHYTNFHHLRVHSIPPLSTKEFVWWSFEEGGGNRVYGSCFLIDALEVNGTINNLSSMTRRLHVSNIHGRALYSNGTSTAYTNFTDVLDFNPTDAFSVSAWIRIDAITASDDYVIIAKIQQGNERGWKLYLTKNASHNLEARFVLQQGRNTQRIIGQNPLVITPGSWYFIVATYDGTPYFGNQDIPADALKVFVTPFENISAQTASTPSILDGLKASSNPTNSGNLLIGAEISGSNPFNGSIDEVRIFKTALTGTEMNRIFQKEK